MNVSESFTVLWLPDIGEGGVSQLESFCHLLSLSHQAENKICLGVSKQPVYI